MLYGFGHVLQGKSVYPNMARSTLQPTVNTYPSPYLMFRSANLVFPASNTHDKEPEISQHNTTPQITQGIILVRKNSTNPKDWFPYCRIIRKYYYQSFYTACTFVKTSTSQYAILLIQIFASFRPLWRQNSVVRSHFFLLIHPICSFLPPQMTGRIKIWIWIKGILRWPRVEWWVLK